jgi:hypothetical protein
VSSATADNITKDPAFAHDPQLIENLRNRISAAVADGRRYRPGFADLDDRIRSEPGTPGQISDPGERHRDLDERDTIMFVRGRTRRAVDGARRVSPPSSMHATQGQPA